MSDQSTLVNWTSGALSVRIAQYRKEGKDASSYTAEMNRRLRILAAVAVTACDTADRVELANGTAAEEFRAHAMDASEAFFDLANAQLTDEQDAQLTDLCAKADPQEQIQHTLDVLKVTRS